MSDASVCRDCGKPTGGGVFKKGETRILGLAYCDACVQARTLYCHACRTGLSEADFANGLAVTLLGRRYCEDCLESAVKEGRARAERAPEKPRADSPTAAKEDGLDGAAIAIRRLYGRYVPHVDAALVVKSGGALAWLRGNLSRLWLDVSEGGFRAILAGRHALEDRLQGSVRHAPTRTDHPFEALVKHVRLSKRYPGCMLVGAKFDKPSKELQAFIRDQMSGRLVMIPSPASEKPSSTSNPPVHPSPA